MADAALSDRLRQFVGRRASEFVLHRGSMLLLDRVIDPGPEITVCDWTVTASNGFLEPGRGVPAYVGVEYMAQCVAVHAGVRARAEGRGPPLGFLLGTRHYKSIVGYFDAGATYRASCRELMRGDGMGSYECRIFLQDKVVAQGRLAVLEKERGGRRRG